METVRERANEVVLSYYKDLKDINKSNHKAFQDAVGKASSCCDEMIKSHKIIKSDWGDMKIKYWKNVRSKCWKLDFEKTTKKATK